MKLTIKPVFALIMMGAITLSSALMAEAGKCSPCQLAKSIRDAAAQSIRDAQIAALAAGKPFSREAVIAALEKCGCSKTKRDEIIADLTADLNVTVAACCEYCAQPGSLGCQGENAARCNTCLQGQIRMAKAEAAVAAMLRAVAVAAKQAELDIIPSDVARAPREELADPCNPCGIPACDPCGNHEFDPNCSNVEEFLRYNATCCSIVNQRVIALTDAQKKCCKKLGHKIHDVEELVESVIDTSAACCSVTEGLLVSVIDTSAECCSVIEGLIGDPGTSFLDITLCQPITLADAIINGTDADVLTWLKTIAEWVYRINSCVCCLG